MIDFLTMYAGPFRSDVGSSVGDSTNAANAKAAAKALRAAGCVKVGDEAADDGGHRTTASVWRRG